MTAHNEAKKEDIAKIVLMAGDPLRASFFAKKYLKNYKLVNSLRGMLAFTGYINDLKVTVMGHGMGMESIGIYAYELYKFYDVDIIIRFGSCGGYIKELNLYDLIIAEKAYSESNYGLGFNNEINDTMEASHDLVEKAILASKKLKFMQKTKIGKIHSSLWFYTEGFKTQIKDYVDKKIIAVEMESYALYLIAKTLNKKALTILTVSDNLITKKEIKGIERQKGFTDMFELLKEIVTNLN
ncbi:purine-nucleoside phosphorylase [Candidatus Hepatoplasma crinochetorum]|uniref:purine-nucleoside phosphorylase n=1 Tax=Candidatus Hepatoplasma crinochetorum TaxID=295596 RepID=UPI003092E374|nr:MAG: purine nucleoside phosphorylase DeoD-type [Candidatus Hepatoplasma crinochetorum]